MINIDALHLKLLYVEDEKAVRTALTQIISEMGFEVNAFKDAESAWDSYEKDEYAVVLADWELPGMTGFELCRKIHKTSPNKSVLIIITGYDEQDKLYKILTEGIDDYIIKDSNARDLKIRLTIAVRIYTERMIIQKSNKRIKKSKLKIENIHSDFSQVFNSVKDGIILIDNKFNITQVNQSFLEIFSMKEPVIMKKCYEILNKFLCVDCSKNCPLKGQIEHTEKELKIFSESKRKLVFLYSISPLIDSSNISYGIIISFKDITERRLIENRYRSLFEESKDMILSTSLEGDILEINNTGLELLGFSSFSELKNKKIFDYYNN